MAEQDTGLSSKHSLREAAEEADQSPGNEEAKLQKIRGPEVGEDVAGGFVKDKDESVKENLHD